jgi:hypothetical protein
MAGTRCSVPRMLLRRSALCELPNALSRRDTLASSGGPGPPPISGVVSPAPMLVVGASGVGRYKRVYDASMSS